MKDIEWEKFLSDNEGLLLIPGAIYKSYGPKDYIGAALAVSGTLYFKGAHTPAGRAAVLECFAAYKKIADAHLQWFIYDGAPPVEYAAAKNLAEILKSAKEEAPIFSYTSGKDHRDAGPYEFHLFSRQGWHVDMGRGLNGLRFALPLLLVETNPTAFISLFVSFAKLLQAESGHGGYGLVLSKEEEFENQPTEAVVAEQLLGMDVGSVRVSSRYAAGGLKTVSWLTAVNKSMLAQLDGKDGLYALQGELPSPWYAYYDYGNGIVIQAGPQPEACSVSDDPRPARYVLVNMLLKQFRSKKVRDFHGEPRTGEPYLGLASTAAWMQRFDVPEDELLYYKKKLLQEPKLQDGSYLPDGRISA
ncbi:DUF3396 domain-containing protein [Xanthomonas cerealis pv. cerealis]|uniref:type VI immunity family protein n=1 Tax=Xanthomonas cerealis TaxID=3390025 RepID=UPI001F45EFA2|nr:type VI immunity family protein [Xanthomonas translucens]UKE70553.1 DUF3396 domain-containing protein [Xanthomonas translucens pv. pistacia]